MAAMLMPTTTSTELHFDTNWASPARMLVAVAGDVDLATADQLRDRLLGVLREHAPAVLDVDLAEVAFLDCAGVRALVTARHAALSAGHQMWIVHPRPIVRRVLEVTGLLGMLTAPSDSDAAAGRAAAITFAPVARTS